MFLCVFLCFHPFGDFHGKDFPSVYNIWDVVLAKPHWLDFGKQNSRIWQKNGGWISGCCFGCLWRWFLHVMNPFILKEAVPLGENPGFVFQKVVLQVKIFSTRESMYIWITVLFESWLNVYWTLSNTWRDFHFTVMAEQSWSLYYKTKWAKF